jgi:hypothetical protein
MVCISFLEKMYEARKNCQGSNNHGIAPILSKAEADRKMAGLNR